MTKLLFSSIYLRLISSLQFTMDNSLITSVAREDETPQVKACCCNIANAIRDESEYPLHKRLDEIVKMINEQNPDVLILLEAGRSSGGKSWTRLAMEIEEGTGLIYVGIYLVNATDAPFGKALFIRKSAVAVKSFDRAWIGDTLMNTWGGDRYGSDILQVILHPVQDGKVITDRAINLWAAHFPLGRDARLAASQALADAITDNTIVLGDFNCFHTDKGPEMIQTITSRWTEHKLDCLWTFSAFPHDIVDVPAKIRDNLPEGSEVVAENEEKGTITVRFVGMLDRVFSSKDVNVEQTHTAFSDKASDHALITVTAQYGRV